MVMEWRLKTRQHPPSHCGRINLFVVAMAVSSLLGCAPRKYLVIENQINFETESHFYLILNEEASKVQYRYFSNPFDYSKYGGGRSKDGYVLEVPIEIAKYLRSKSKNVEMGTGSKSPSKDTVIIDYQELWGWDMGRILKRVKINMYKGASAPDTASVEFKEMTIINTHPTPKELIPKMLDTLFLQSKLKFDKSIL